MNTTSKVIVTLVPTLSRCLEANGYNVDQLVNSLQSEANNPRNRTVGESKRGNVSGGTRFSAEGSISSEKDLQLKLSTPETLTYKSGTMPLEFIKFNDGLANLFKKVGQPNGEISLGLIPAHLVVWLTFCHKSAKPVKADASKSAESKSAKRDKATKPDSARNGNVPPVGTPQVPA